MLKANGLDVAVGGNIGVNVLDLPPPTLNTIFVLELSSYQIDLTPSLAPSFGLLLNITPDHIDRHGTFKNYAAVKERLVTASTLAIVGVDGDRETSADPCWSIVERKTAQPGAVALFARGQTRKQGVTFGHAGYLCRSINGRQSGMAPLAETLADLNDAPALGRLGAHLGEGGAGAIDRAGEVGVEDAVPVLQRHLVQGHGGGAAAGVVEEAVDAAEARGGGVEEGLHRLVVGHVRGHGEGGGVAAGRLRQRVGAAAGEGDVPAGGQEGPGGGAADAGAC